MAAGTATWSDISGTANQIKADSLAVARMAVLLLPTVTSLSASGMNIRQVDQWNSLTFSQHTEETDEASTDFSKSALATLTPLNYHCRVDLTDERLASDSDAVRAAASLELGSAAAAHVDGAIGDLFGTATAWAGTIGPANAGTAVGGTITWRAITKAYALLVNQGVPAGAPIYCAMHPLTVAA